VCERAINEITVDAAAKPGSNLIQELVDTLRHANVLDLFFSPKNIHEQLVNKSNSVLRLLMRR